jgi:DNA-binding transcriptional MerR regulator
MPKHASTASLSIGELAERSGVTREAIRYYEREGVLPPPTRGGAGRYRLYSDADAQRLAFVRRARDLGFSLDEVRELLDLAASDPSRPCGDVNSVAHTHLANVRAKLAQLTAMERELTRLVRACDLNASIGECSLLEALANPAARTPASTK